MPEQSTPDSIKTKKRGYWSRFERFLPVSGFIFSLVSLIVSLVSLNISQTQTEIARRSFEVGQRADVIFDGSALREPLVVGKKTWVELVLRNSGNLLAVKGKFTKISWSIRPAPFTGSLEYRGEGPPVHFSLKPTERLGLSIPLDLFGPSAEAIAELDAGRGVLFVFAQGEYADELGRTYILPFCYRYDPNVPQKLVICSDDIRIGMPIDSLSVK